MAKEYLFKGGSMDNKKRKVQSFMYYVPFFKDNGRFYVEKYRLFKDEFIYEGTSLKESEIVADSLGSWRKAKGQEFSERELKLKGFYDEVRSNMSMKGARLSYE